MSGSETKRSGLTRRGFLKATGAIVGASALAEGTTLSALAAGEAESVAEEQIFFNTCPVNCGNATFCNFKTHVRDGKAMKITANTDTWRVPEELAGELKYTRRVCLRGRSHIQWTYGENRVLYPLRRAEGTERGAGEWERISWDEAINEIAERFTAIREQYGNQAIFGVGLTGNGSVINGPSGAYARLMNALEGTQCDYCLDWGFSVGELRVYGSMYKGSNDGVLYKKAKNILLWGNNMTESVIQRWVYVDQARKAGTKLICIDPRFSVTASKSDQFVPLKPGTDLQLANAMIRYIIDNDLMDVEYMVKNTGAPFLVREDNGMYLHMSDLGVAPTEGPVNPLTQQPTIIDPAVVMDAATGQPMSNAECTDPVLRGSFEVNGVKVSTALDKLWECVEEATLDWASAQTGIDEGVIAQLARDYSDGPNIILIQYGFEKYDNADKVSHALMTLSCLTGNFSVPGGGMGCAGSPNGKCAVMCSASILPDGRKSTSIPWLCVPDILETGKFMGEDYPIKAMLMMAGNPLSNQSAKNTWIEELFPKLEFIVTAETRMTDTARYSDIVLPAAHIFEKQDFTSLTWMSLNEQAIEPLGEAKIDWEMGRLITEAMGMQGDFPPDPVEYMKTIINSNPNAEEYALTYEDLMQQKVMFNMKRDGYNLMNYDNIDENPPAFPTASGKLEFYCENPFPRMMYGQEFNPAEYRLPYMATPREVYEGNPQRKVYPLVYWQEHTRWRIHTSFGDLPWLREIDREPVCKLSPKDAEERGIVTGDIVKVFNDRGYVVVKAIVDNTLPAGMCNVPKGWEAHQFIAGDYQDLTNNYINPSTVNQSYYDVLVDVQKEN